VHQHRYPEGIAMLETAVKQMTDNAIAHYNLGRAYITVGQLDEAQEVLKKALAINPDVKEVHFNLARVFQEKGELEKAKTSCKHALKLDPSYGRAKAYLEFLSEIRQISTLNFEDLRQALKDFDANDTAFMIRL
jgi:tetratricopeptide (TPR) repeat protein